MTHERTDTPVVLAVHGLDVTFRSENGPVPAVRGLSFHVNAGETLAIVGESGSGKSVTSLALMRLVEQGGGTIDRGTMVLTTRNGERLDLARASTTRMRELRGADIAMVFQEPMTSLNPVFTIGDQIAESIRLHQHLGGREAQAEALAMLERVRIPEARNVMTRYPHQLSGGMRQRVMIAMALACRPRLLIADEPTTALDVTIQAQILGLIDELQREMQMAVIFITHDMGVVAEIADRVLVMHRGRKVEEETCRELFQAPREPYTRALLAAVPQLGAMRGTDQPERFELPMEVDRQESAITVSTPTPAPLRDIAADGLDAAPAAASVDHSEPIVIVRDLVTRFDLRSGLLGRVTRQVHAVEHVSLDLHPGETLAVVGESGSGKSTLGRSIARLVEFESGSVHVGGVDVSAARGDRLRELRRHVQFIFQDPYASLDPRLTIGYSVLEPMLIHGTLPRIEAERRVTLLLQRVGLPADAAQRYPHEFSGGQRQRIAIARAMALNPSVIIADEAVAALDVSIRAHVINLMMDLQRDFGVAYLFISHDMAVVERISHRVAVMYLGQIVEIGTRRQVFENPQHPYTKRLMDAVPVADPARRRRRTLDAREIPSPVRAVGDHPIIAPLVEIESGHLVAMHPVGGIVFDTAAPGHATGMAA